MPIKQPAYLKVQHMLLAACIILAPLSITLYLLSWPEKPQPVFLNNTVASGIVTSTMAGPTGNSLHLIGAVAASFFLPLGYLGMSLLGMRRALWHLLLKLALFGLGVIALFAAGRWQTGTAFAAVVIINIILAYAWGQETHP